MKKRLVSILLSVALLLSCVGGITLFAVAEELPAPYASFSFGGENGAAVISGGVVRYINAAETNDNIPVGQAIGDTGKYGFTVSQKNYGLYFGGKVLQNVPQNTEVTFVVEYYLNSDTPLSGTLIELGLSGDTLIGYSSLPQKTQGVIYYTITAEQLNTLRERDLRLRMYFRDEAVGKLYVTSCKIVPAAALGIAADPGYAYYSMGEKGTCPYYPEAMVNDNLHVTVVDAEKEDKFPDRPWMYRYLRVSGTVKSTDRTQNKPVYVKLYAADGYENDTVGINEYEYSNGTTSSFASAFGAPAFAVNMQNGVGGVYIPAACLSNNLNAGGSLRFWWSEAEKITRAEVYDVATYCNEAGATDAMKAELHAGMVSNKQNLTLTAEGAECATCGALLAEGSLDVNYMQINFNRANGADLIEAETTAGSPVAVGDTGLYGYPFTASDRPFMVTNTADFGVTAEDIDNGVNLQVTLELYFSGAGAALDKGNLEFGSTAIEFFGGTEATAWGALPVNEKAIVTGQKVSYTYLVGKEAPYGDSSAFAKKLVNGEECMVVARGYNNVIGKNPLYILSIKVEKACEHESTHVEGAKEATDTQAGYTGDTVCDTCGAVVQAGSIIRPGQPADYMQINFNTVGTPLLVGVSSTDGTGTEIPGTGVYGYRFSYDWDAFSFIPGNIGLTADDIDNGAELTVIVEYYSAGATYHSYPQIALSAGSGAPGAAICLFDGYCHWDNVQVNEGNLPLVERATVTFTLGKDSPNNLGDLAKQLLSADSATWTGHCYSGLFGAAPIYLLSFTICEAGKEELICAHENLRVEDAKDATCTEEGYTGNVICDDCGATSQGVAIPTHEKVQKEAVEPTCLKNGRTAGEWCTVCEEYVSGGEIVPAHETTLINVKERSCNEAGYSGDVWCTVCELVVAEGYSTGTVPHSWNEGEITKQPTPSAVGEFTKTCTVCGATIVTDVEYEGMAGDVNGDGAIDSTDARLVLQYAVGKIQETALDISSADVNGDSEVDSTDARLILQYAVGKIREFPQAK